VSIAEDGFWTLTLGRATGPGIRPTGSIPSMPDQPVPEMSAGPPASPAADPAHIAPTLPDLATLDAAIADCRACPRLVEWREDQARTKVARFRDETYWGRAVPGFGPADARILLVGLAPAAHGANRTGRVFTGDASGDFLWRALHEAGLANQPDGRRAGDGLELLGVRVVAAVRCAPPANKPTAVEQAACRPYLVRELQLLPALTVIVPLGAIGWDATLRSLAATGHGIPSPRPRFGHGAEARIGPYRLVGSYHPSQQNTFTGRLTPEMMEAVLTRAGELARA
jgi:uracil-DNA glycosylase family 4